MSAGAFARALFPSVIFISQCQAPVDRFLYALFCADVFRFDITRGISPKVRWDTLLHAGSRRYIVQRLTRLVVLSVMITFQSTFRGTTRTARAVRSRNLIFESYCPDFPINMSAIASIELMVTEDNSCELTSIASSKTHFTDHRTMLLSNI